MFRNLAIRAIIPVCLAVTGFVVVCCFLLYGLIREDISKDTIKHEISLADTVIKSTHYSMLQADQESIHRIVTNIGSQEGVEHIRIFNPNGVIFYSKDPAELKHAVDKKSAGCIGCHDRAVPAASLGGMEQARRFVNNRGVPVIAITAPIYNEPSCSAAACHVHPAGQKVLGILDIGLSAQPLQSTLATLGSRMIIFCLMVLFLTIGGVAAILRRSVFLPLQNLVEYTSDRVANISDGKHPRFNCEIKHMEYNFRMVEERLQKELGNESSRTATSPEEG